LAYGLSVAVRVLIVLRDDDALRNHAMRLITLSEEGGFHQFLSQGLCALGWLELRTGAPEHGLARLRSGLAGMRDLAVIASLPFYQSLLADMPSVTAQRCIALDEALELSGRTADIWFTAELHRRRSALLADPALAETELQRALAIARGQSAKLFELRAATGLARLWAAQQNRDAARDLLVSVHGWFKEGRHRPDLSDAKRLLDELVVPPGRSRPQ
jgi:predicted ATPase